MNDTKVAALAAAGLIAAAPVAQASATATAAIGNFHYTLIDLDLNDGIEPALSFSGNAAASVSAGWYPSFSTQCDCQTAVGAIGSAVSVTRTIGSSIASASILAGDAASGSAMGLGASVSLASLVDGQGGYAGASVLGGDFILTPHTLLVFTAASSGLSVATTVLGQTVSARVELQLYDGIRSANSVSSWNINSNGSQAASLAPELMVSLPNYRDISITVNGSAVTSVTISDVPEPATYAFMMSGLLALRLIIRRQRLG